MRNTISILLILIIYSCNLLQINKSVIRIIGSDTMLELTKHLANEFNKDYPNILITVEGGGSKHGIEKLINGKADICTSSRKLYPEEAKKMVENYNSLGVANLIAIDALSIFVNVDNPVENLSNSELKNIFTGKIKNWKKLNSDSLDIKTVIRNKDSGTYLFFKEYILEGEEYDKNSITLPTTKEIIDFIKENKNAIGYGGIGYAKNVKIIAVNGIIPNAENILNNKYLYFRYLYFFTVKEPEGEIKLFIDWINSPKGQKVVSESGYFPLLNIKE